MTYLPFERKPVPVSPPVLLAVAHPDGEKTEANPKSRLLEAAEKLIGDLGVAATSIRAITSAAGVNPAAITYHFGSKNGLVEAVYTRRLAPIDRLRLEMLNRCEKLHGPRQLPLELVVEAFIAPLFKIGGCLPIIGRMYTEPASMLPSPVVGRMNEIEARFVSALGRALPDRNSTDLRWGMVFLTGMVVRTTSGSPPGAGFSLAIARQIVRFACAGLRSLPANGPELAA
jgi:AcrR family transcriptional regulator